MHCSKKAAIYCFCRWYKAKPTTFLSRKAHQWSAEKCIWMDTLHTGRCPCPYQGSWNQMIFKVSFYPNHSMILWWFCELSAMCYIHKHPTEILGMPQCQDYHYPWLYTVYKEKKVCDKELHKIFLVPLQLFLDYFFALHFHILQWRMLEFHKDLLLEQEKEHHPTRWH